MNVTQLEYFITTVNQGSYAAAAKKLYVTPQAVSKGVSDLEKELEVDLFTKSGRSIEATPDGLILANRAVEIITMLDDLKDIAISLRRARKSHNISGQISLAIASSPWEGSVIAHGFFESFAQGYPTIKLNLSYNSSGTCLSAVQEGVIDASVIIGRVCMNGFTCVKLFDVELCIAVSENHSLATKKEISFRDLANYRIIKPDDLRYSYKKIVQRFEAASVTPAFINSESTEQETVNLLGSSNAVQFVKYSRKLKIAHPEITLLPLRENEKISLPICLVFNEKSNEIIDVLKKRLLEVSRGGMC